MIASLLAASRFDRLLRLLDQERKVILNGPLTELSALVAKRETLLEELLEQERELPEAFVTALKALDGGSPDVRDGAQGAGVVS